MSADEIYNNLIININSALQDILATALKMETAVETDEGSDGEFDGLVIRFDLPEANTTQSVPTLSIFLYDLYEDVGKRQSEQNRFDIRTGMRAPGRVNLCCNYLITYWEASAGGGGDGPQSAPDSQAFKVITKIIKALLINRELSAIPGAYTSVIQPQENLNSLGNFWQALDNRPRLSLRYSVTAPIQLDQDNEAQPLVKTVESEITQNPAVDLNKLNALLWKTLCQQLGAGAEQKLARVQITSVLQVQGDDAEASTLAVRVEVAGPVATGDKDTLEAVLKTWQDNTNAVTEINGVAVQITELVSDSLIFI